MRDQSFFIKPRIYQLLLQGEMGLINPRSPPGSANPSLRECLYFFQTSIVLGIREAFVILISIYIFLQSGRTPNVLDPNIQSILEKIYGKVNPAKIQFGVGKEKVSDIHDLLTIHQPEDTEIGSDDCVTDLRIIRRTSDTYRMLKPGDTIYLSDGKSIQVENEYKLINDD